MGVVWHFAFANPKSPKLIRFWRYFRSSDLYPEGYSGEFGVRTLMTVDEQADGWHICFMQDNISEIGNVAHSVERLATAVYFEPCAHGRPWAPRRSGLFTSLADRFARRRRVTALDPYRFHFYQHIPPGEGRREAFDRVALGFELGEYRNPEWLGYPVIPQVVLCGQWPPARCAVEGRRLSGNVESTTTTHKRRGRAFSHQSLPINPHGLLLEPRYRSRSAQNPRAARLALGCRVQNGKPSQSDKGSSAEIIS